MTKSLSMSQLTDLALFLLPMRQRLLKEGHDSYEILLLALSIPPNQPKHIKKIIGALGRRRCHTANTFSVERDYTFQLVHSQLRVQRYLVLFPQIN